MKTKTTLILGLSLLAAPSASWADETQPAADAPAQSLEQQAPLRSADELDQLLGPIALYPDAMIALILPATTNAADIVLAARYLDAGGDMYQVDGNSWDPSVKGLVHYPDVIHWLDQNLEWTNQLGDAFASQPADVMQAIQRLRARARAAGTLQSTPQQQVVVQDNAICIVPASPNIIYVPSYDPQVVYVERPYYSGRSLIFFDDGWAVGSWLSFDCEWQHDRIWWSPRPSYWRSRNDWRYPVFPGNPRYVHGPERSPWRPAHYRRVEEHRFDHLVVRPTVNLDVNVQRGGWNHREGSRDVSPGRTHTGAGPDRAVPNRGPWRPSNTLTAPPANQSSRTSAPEHPSERNRAAAPFVPVRRVAQPPVVSNNQTTHSWPAATAPTRQPQRQPEPRNVWHPTVRNVPTVENHRPENRPAPSSMPAPAPAAQQRQDSSNGSGSSDTKSNTGPWRRGRQER